MVGCKLIIKKKKKKGSDWLATMLQTEFFGPCTEHLRLKKNEKNVFCMDCNIAFCRNCEDDHRRHSRLRICKYVYQDVVRLKDMQKHHDSSRIQTYKINGERAVHLNPRPQQKDAKPTTKSKTGSYCEACGRYIQELPNRFCSIACKLCVVPLKAKEQSESANDDDIDMNAHPKLCNQESSTSDKESSLTQVDPGLDDNQTGGVAENPALRPRKNSSKRKGIPRRAPLS